MVDRIYNIGTVSVANGGTVITGGGGPLWASTGLAYDRISIQGYGECTILGVTDDNHLAIDPWPYASVPAGTSYKLIKDSLDRLSGAATAQAVVKLVTALDVAGFIIFVRPTDTAPDPSQGDEGQYAEQPATGKKWVKTLGVWSYLGIYNPLSPKGTWNSATTYNIGDVVSINGASYIANVSNTNSQPPNANWQVSGSKGDKGDAATIAVGSVTTGAPGSNAIVTNSGTSGAATFNFTVPRGNPGAGDMASINYASEYIGHEAQVRANIGAAGLAVANTFSGGVTLGGAGVGPATLFLNNTGPGGHGYAIDSTDSVYGEGAGKFLIRRLGYTSALVITDGLFQLPYYGAGTLVADGNGNITSSQALAALANPAFTGVPTAPTAALGANTAQLATMAALFAQSQTRAPLASPALTGIPSAPTAALGTNTTQIATMAALVAQRNDLVNGAGAALDTFKELQDALGGDANFATTTATALANRLRIDAAGSYSSAQQSQGRSNLAAAPIDSPTFTGIPAAPTAVAGTNTTQIATTEFAQAASLASVANRLRVDADGAYSDTQKAQGRANIATAPIEAMAYGVMTINCDMGVDQEHAGAAVTFASGTVIAYAVDGLQINKSGTNAFTTQQVASVFPGYDKAIRLTVTTAQATIGSDTIIFDKLIEGYRFVRAGWGTTAAMPVTVGAWVKSSVAGVAGVTGFNSDYSAAAYSNFTIAAANTPQWVTLTFPAQTTGVWERTNLLGMRLRIYLATSGSNINIAATAGNTFDMTGLIVLPGIDVPPASRAQMLMRPFIDEIRMCKRFWEASFAYGEILANYPTISGGETVFIALNSANAFGALKYTVEKRVSPTVTLYSSANRAAGKIREVATGADISATPYSPTKKGVMQITGGPFSGANAFYTGSYIADARF